MKRKNILIWVVAITLLLLPGVIQAIPATITCEFDGMVFVCSDNTAWGTIESAEVYYANLVPSYERTLPDYTFVTGGISTTLTYSGK